MLSANVLQLTVITTTLSVDMVLMVPNAKLSVYVLSLTFLSTTLSFNAL